MSLLNLLKKIGFLAIILSCCVEISWASPCERDDDFRPTYRTSTPYQLTVQIDPQCLKPIAVTVRSLGLSFFDNYVDELIPINTYHNTLEYYANIVTRFLFRCVIQVGINMITESIEEGNINNLRFLPSNKLLIKSLCAALVSELLNHSMPTEDHELKNKPHKAVYRFFGHLALHLAFKL